MFLELKKGHWKNLDKFLKNRFEKGGFCAKINSSFFHA